MNKYSVLHRYPIQLLPSMSRPADKYPFAQAGISQQTLMNILNASVAKSTWEKYSSALNTFFAFESACGKSFQWPISVDICRAFIAWCHAIRHLQPSTIRSYLSALKFAHTIQGLPHDHISDDQITALLLKGVAHISSTEKPQSNTRRVVTFPLLLLLGHRIAVTSWSPLTKQVIWAAATTGFFASARMGEILATSDTMHAPASDLTWNDIKQSSATSLLLRLKQPKSGEQCEFVDLFPFPGFNCCPVAALRSLKAKQIATGIFDPAMPVFRFHTSRNLTQTQLNRTLANLLPDLCSPGDNTITCHSFRAGIPSTLSLFPHLASDDMIKGWGRWQSDCYTRYTRLKLPQKEKIFSSITEALQSTMLPRPDQ